MRLHIRQSVRACIRWLWVPLVAFVIVVAVAMACAVWSPVSTTYKTWGYATPRKVPSSLRRYDGQYTLGLLNKGLGISQYRVVAGPPVFDQSGSSPRVIDVTVVRSGLPVRCLRWTRDERLGLEASSLWARGFEIEGSDRRIPLMPEPVGMVLNVLIVSAAIVLVRLTWQRVVVLRRRRKNLCVKCGYPIETSVHTCPECGGVYSEAKATT